MAFYPVTLPTKIKHDKRVEVHTYINSEQKIFKRCQNIACLLPLLATDRTPNPDTAMAPNMGKLVSIHQ